MFATVRLRHRSTKGNGSSTATLTMVFKLCKIAEKNWRRLKGFEKLRLVQQDVIFVDVELDQRLFTKPCACNSCAFSINFSMGLASPFLCWCGNKHFKGLRASFYMPKAEISRRQ